jgi:hypothetical protein
MLKNHRFIKVKSIISYSIAISTIFVLLPCISCQKESGWSADGVISTNEYANTKTLSEGKYDLYWNTDSNYIYIGINVKTKGFLAIGFNPSGSMLNSDVIFGWVKDGEGYIYDMYITDYSGNHSQDTILGGTDDILEYGIAESDGYTTMEFKRAINTGDKYDYPVSVGSVNKIVWSYGNSDDSSNIHIERGVDTITF